MSKLIRSLIIVVLAGSVVASGPSVSATPPGAHPRLLLDATEAAALPARIAADPELVKARASLLQKVEAYTDRTHPNYLDPALVEQRVAGQTVNWYNNAASQNQMGTYLTDLGFAYLLTGTDKYGDHAVDLLIALKNNGWPAWHNNDLGDGDLMKGVALAFDWAYDRFTPAEAASIAQSLDTWRSTHSCGSPTNNWAGVCGGGRGLMLLAIENEPLPAGGNVTVTADVDATKALVINHFQEVYGDDGDGTEGILYAMYGLHNSLPFGLAWTRRTGQDFFAAAPEVKNVPEWLSYEQLPGDGIRFIPRNDSITPQPLLPEVLPMFFEIRGDGLTGWLWDHTVGPQGERAFESVPTGPRAPVFAGTSASSDPTCTSTIKDPTRLVACFNSAEVFTMLYYQSPTELPRVAPSLPWTRHYEEHGLVDLRTGWSGTSSEVAATFEAKRNAVGHSQEDMGNFTLYGYGGKFALDSGYGLSNSCEGHGPDEPTSIVGLLQGGCYSMASGRASGHNVVLVDPVEMTNGTAAYNDFAPVLRETQQRGSNNTTGSTITEFVSGPQASWMRSDLAYAYGSTIEYANRDFFMSRPSTTEPVILAVTDSLKRGRIGSASYPLSRLHIYEWQMHTDAANTVVPVPSGFVIRSPSGATLSGTLSEAADNHVVALRPWDQTRYGPFEWPQLHTVVVGRTPAPSETFEHLAVMALTAPGQAPATVLKRQVSPTGKGNVAEISWGTKQAFVASRIHGSAVTLTAAAGSLNATPFVTNGDFAKATKGGGENLLANGTLLRVGIVDHVKVTGTAATVLTTGDEIDATGASGNTYRVYVPQTIATVRVNGVAVSSCRSGSYLVFPC